MSMRARDRPITGIVTNATATVSEPARVADATAIANIATSSATV